MINEGIKHDAFEVWWSTLFAYVCMSASEMNDKKCSKPLGVCLHKCIMQYMINNR